MGLSRNAPCHCGSGKKYKKCCLGKEKTVDNTIKAMPQYNQVFESGIDALSNETISLIENNEYEKAEKNCMRLIKEFPDNIDGHVRYGDLFSATGKFDKAIESYEKVIQYMKTNPGFDEEGVDWYKEKIQDLKDKL